jgi:hypothetical protein
MKKITCFVPNSTPENLAGTVAALKACDEIAEVIVFETPFQEAATLWAISKQVATPYTLLYTQSLQLQLGAYAIERMLKVISDTKADMLYADCYKIKDGVQQAHPLIDYQEGSLRDDFDFGSLLLFNSEAFKIAALDMCEDYEAAAFYDLRLSIARDGLVFHLPEFLYT